MPNNVPLRMRLRNDVLRMAQLQWPPGNGALQLHNRE